MNEVLPGLYLGGIYALEEGSQIISNKIDAIVTVGEFFCEFHKPHLKNLARIKLNLRDNKDCDILQHVSTVNSFIQKKRLDKKNVFVHCFGGVSRSVAFVIAYLMTITDLTLETCLNYVKTKRRAAQPNEGFLKQLEKYQLELLDEEKRRLKAEFDSEEFKKLSKLDVDFIGAKDNRFFKEDLALKLNSIDFQQLSV